MCSATEAMTTTAWTRILSDAGQTVPFQSLRAAAALCGNVKGRRSVRQTLGCSTGGEFGGTTVMTTGSGFVAQCLGDEVAHQPHGGEIR
jgi:hypothetical protein